jgi:hypothetical protein
MKTKKLNLLTINDVYEKYCNSRTPSKDTIRRYARNGDLPCIQAAGHTQFYFLEEDVKNFFSSRKVKAKLRSNVKNANLIIEA